MKRLDRYVIKELFLPLVIGTVVFAMLFVANDMIFIYKTFNVEAVPFLAIVQLLMFKFPFWLNITFPIGTALGASLAISRMARESEITAMRAAGISISRVFRPLIFVGLVMAVGNYLVTEKLVPPASIAYRKLVNEVGFLAMMPKFRSNVNMNVGRYSAIIGSVTRGDSGKVDLRDIILVERPRPGETRIYNATSGTYQDGLWVVKSPFVVVIKGTTIITAVTKDDLPINERIRIADLFGSTPPEEEPIEVLAETIRLNKAARSETTTLEIALHQRFSTPVTCLIFAFTSAVLAMRFAKAGPFIGVIVSLGLVWLNFNLYIICGEVLGKHGWLPPVAAAWLPNLIFAIFGLLLMRRLE